MRRFALFIALAAFVATVALLDAITRGSFVAPEGPPAAVDGTGPILVASSAAGGHRGAIGRGRIALLVSPRSSTVARAIAGALARTGLSATFALTAEIAIGDPSLTGDLRKSGHDVAYAGVAAADAASLPEPLWRVAETLGLRMVESAAGERLALYAPARLLGGRLDEGALIEARRASALGLVSLAPAAAPANDTATDGLVVITNTDDVGGFAAQGSRARLVSLRALAGLNPEPPLDPLRAAADDRRVTVIQKQNGGKASALNHGFSSTRADVIVVVDADSIIERDAIAELVKPLADARVGAVAGNVKVGNRWSVLGVFQHLEYVMGINLDRRFFDEVDAISVVPGTLGSFRREALETVGRFPTDTLAEDADLTVAIGERGFHVRHASYARAWTEVPSALGALRRQRFRWTYGILQVLWKHRGAPVRRGATNVGRLGLPYLLVFGYLLPLLSPAVDAVVVYGLIVAGARPEVVALFGVVTGLQLLAAMFALRLDGENIAWAAGTLPMQLGYRQFLSFVTISALGAAVAGFPVSWGKLRRRGLPAEVGRN